MPSSPSPRLNTVRDAISQDPPLAVPDALAAADKDPTPAGQEDVELKAVLAATPHAPRVVEDVFDGVAESFARLAENDK